MKIFQFDAAGTMTVSVTGMGKDRFGNDVADAEKRVIQPEQIGAHLPMFAADMSAAELAEANAIIAAQ